MKHFLKEIVQTGLRGANGKIIVWEKLAQNFGVLALADGDPNVAILNDFAERKVGGVAAITPEQYEDYKKKTALRAAAAQAIGNSNLRHELAAVETLTGSSNAAAAASDDAAARSQGRVCPRCHGAGTCRQCGGKRKCFKCGGRGYI